MYKCTCQLETRRKGELSLQCVPLGMGVGYTVPIQCFASFRS